MADEPIIGGGGRCPHISTFAMPVRWILRQAVPSPMPPISTAPSAQRWPAKSSLLSVCISRVRASTGLILAPITGPIKVVLQRVAPQAAELLPHLRSNSSNCADSVRVSTDARNGKVLSPSDHS